MLVTSLRMSHCQNRMRHSCKSHSTCWTSSRKWKRCCTRTRAFRSRKPERPTDTGTAGRPALLPQLFPIPDPVRHFLRQRKSELTREHTHLSAMVGFMHKHVAQHFWANRPRRGPAVSVKLLHAALFATERLSEHLAAAGGALSQSRAGLPGRAVRAIELWRRLQVRSRKPDPLAA